MTVNFRPVIESLSESAGPPLSIDAPIPGSACGQTLVLTMRPGNDEVTARAGAYIKNAPFFKRAVTSAVPIGGVGSSPQQIPKARWS